MTLTGIQAQVTVIYYLLVVPGPPFITLLYLLGTEHVIERGPDSLYGGTRSRLPEGQVRDEHLKGPIIDEPHHTIQTCQFDGGTIHPGQVLWGTRPIERQVMRVEMTIRSARDTSDLSRDGTLEIRFPHG